jgi:hypothetical protein
MGIIIVGIILLALIYNPSNTASLVITAVSIRGVVWIAKKTVEKINFDASQIIDFVGWSIAGVSIVKIISNAMASVGQVKDFFMGISNCIYKIAEIVDKITFWN